MLIYEKRNDDLRGSKENGQGFTSGGAGYEEIADKLSAAGYVSGKYKQPIKKGGAWNLVNTYNESGSPKPRKRRKTRMAKSMQGNNSKWDVLKIIENCADFRPATKKALIQLIVQEVCG